ncbi:transmembrane protein [Thraustotheca clavata]|uniref:Transmembrane protein n=1 Tax=Thraustotheca clavata TaxID=74557 RepID=A0A1V9ZES1_9STRA|nr:transmembrane protein [Thraustotheca clavata]
MAPFRVTTPPQSPPILDYNQCTDVDTDGCEYQTDLQTLDISESDKQIDEEPTALAPGTPVHVFSKLAILLYLQSTVVTFMQNILPPLKVYIFTAYLQGSPTSIVQLTALENIAWTTRVFFALLSDFLPVFGYRRKFWMCLGWVICCIGILIMAVSSFGTPFCDPKVYPTCWNPKANTTLKAYDFDAPNRVAWYRIPIFVATLGVVMVAASVDGLMVEYAQREPFNSRGQIQTIVYALTGTGGLMARFFNQFFLNGARYGGNYDFSVGPNVPYWASLGMGLGALIAVVVMNQDTKTTIKPFNEWARGLILLLQNRAVYQLLAFRYLFNLFSTVTGATIITWVTNLDMGWINITPRMLFVPATYHFGRYGLSWNWRRVVGTATICNIVLMAMVTFFVIYDVSRNAWVYTALILLTGIPVAVNNLVTGLAMVEMTQFGYEAICAGLWATIRDLNVPVAAKIRTWILDDFPVNMKLNNDSYTQNQVAYTHIIAFSIQLAGLVWLVLLPTQKTPVALMKQHGYSVIAGTLVIIGYVALVAFITPQTPRTPPILEDSNVDYHTEISISDVDQVFDEIELSTLAPGEPVDVQSPPAKALYIQSMVSVFMQNLLPPLNLYLFSNYLHTSQGYLQLTALTNLAWTFRVLFAVLSDVLPVFGCRRKFWLILGWFITLVSIAAMAFSSLGNPYCDPEIHPLCWSSKANSTSGEYDLNAPSRAGYFRAPTFFATLGVVMVTASVDGIMVEYAQREPFITRGQIQVMIGAIAGSGGLIARFFIQFFLNAKRYGGNYSWSAGPNVPYYLSLFMALVGLVGAIVLVKGTRRVLDKQSSQELDAVNASTSWANGLWKLLQNRAIYQLLAFRVLFNLFSTITGTPIVSWVKNLDMGWYNITPRVLIVSATLYFGKVGLHWNWRRSLAVGTIGNLFLMVLITFFVIYDVSRNAYVYSILLVLTGVPLALINLVTGFVMVEMATVGYEAVVAALWASIKDLNVPIATRIHNDLMNAFPVSLLEKNGMHTQNQVGYTHIIAFSIQLLGLIWIVLLPSQKTPVAMMKEQNKSLIGGVLDPTEFDPNKGGDYYGDSTTIQVNGSTDDEETQSTALAPGERISIFSKQALILYFQSIVSTFMQNLLPPLKIYVFFAYLHSSTLNYQQLGYLENLAWTTRVCFALLSDFLPVFGYRRKFWLSLGWVITCVSLACMAFSEFGSPFCDPQDYPQCWNPKGNTTLKAYDFAAPSRVEWYRTPTFFATLGVVIVAANIDGIMVEYAQKEPINERGQIQAVVYALTGTGGLAARFFIQLMLNGKRYGGTYDWSVGASVPYIISFSFGIIALAVAVFLLKDVPRDFVPLEQWCNGLWKLLQNRAVFQLLAFRFLYYLFNNVYGNALIAFGLPMIRWVNNLDMGWINITPRLLFVPATVFIGRSGLQWNWRIVLTSVTFANIFVTSFATFFVIYDICRNAWFYTALIILTGIFAAINYLVQGLMMVELAGFGYEAVIAALWATLKDLNVPIANKWHTYITDQFPVKSMLLIDDDHTRKQVSYTHIISFSIQIFGLIWFLLVPTQKLSMQALKSLAPSAIGGVFVVAGYIALLGHLQIYQAMKELESPCTDNLEFTSYDCGEDQPLGSGDPVPVFSRTAFEFYVQNMTSMFLQNVFPVLNTALLGSYLHASPNQVICLENFAWTLRLLFGICSDVIPVFGYRRKFWLVFGWLLTAVNLGILSFHSIGAPFCDPKQYPLCRSPNAKVPHEAFNFDAPNQVNFFRGPSFLAVLGVVIVTSSLDGVLIEYAQREPRSYRGLFQTAAALAMGIGALLARLFNQCFINGKRYGGFYNWSVGPNVAYIVGFVPTLIALFTAAFSFQDSNKFVTTQKEWWLKVWEQLQKRCTYQLLAFRWIFTLFSMAIGISVLPWVKNLDMGWINVTPRVLYAPGMILTFVLSRSVSWRYSLTIATVGYVFLVAFPTLFVVWDVCRNPWFFSIFLSCASIFSSTLYLVPEWILVEMTTPGMEGTLSALWNSAKDVNTPIATQWHKLMVNTFSVNLALKNHIHTQNQVGSSQIICLALQLISVVLLVLVPSQKIPLAILKNEGGLSKLGGISVILVYVGLIIFAWQQNFHDY